jgi:hypothetical protein
MTFRVSLFAAIGSRNQMCRARLKARFLLLALALSAFANISSASATQRTLFAGCGHQNQLKFAPEELILSGCVSGEPQRLTGMNWKPWGKRRATGTGSLEDLQSCGTSKDCAGTPVALVSVVLDKPFRCTAGRVFLRVTIRSLRTPKNVLRREEFPCPGPPPVS